MGQMGAARSVFEDCWNRQDFDSIECVLGSEFEFHIGGTTRTMGIAELREIVGMVGVGSVGYSVAVLRGCQVTWNSFQSPRVLAT